MIFFARIISMQKGTLNISCRYRKCYSLTNVCCVHILCPYGKTGTVLFMLNTPPPFYTKTLPSLPKSQFFGLSTEKIIIFLGYESCAPNFFNFEGSPLILDFRGFDRQRCASTVAVVSSRPP